MARPAIHWNEGEIYLLTSEAQRLIREGSTASIIGLLTEAQLALPKERRRPIDATSKALWFSDVVKAARKPANARKQGRPRKLATPLAPAPVEAPAAPAVAAHKGTRVQWSTAERQLLCETAARLMTDLEASGPRDAIEKAMAQALPVERQRHIPSMTPLADWFFPGVKRERELLLERRAAATAEDVLRQDKEAREAIAAAAEEAAAIEKAAELARRQVPELAPASTAPHFAPAGAAGLASMFGGWGQIRAYLVQEIAGIVADGIHQGLAMVQLGQHVAHTDPPAAGAPAKHTPFVRDDKPTKRLQSVLVVGLKDAVASQIRAEYGSRLDLRFITPDKSKDQLRQMTEQADITIAVTDFLSHSHTGIIKARSKHYVESQGGVTHLRSQLAALASPHMNGNGLAV
jgi:hypothetical protein